MQTIRFAVLAGLVTTVSAAAVPSQAQGFLGQPVDVTQQFIQPPNHQVNFDFGTHTINSTGTSFSDPTVNSTEPFTIFITPTQITYLLSPTTSSFGPNTPPFFSGYVVTENGSKPGVVTSAALDSATTATGFTASSITFDSSDIFANFDGGVFSTGQKLVIDYTANAPAAVPEASTTVSFGLLLALGLGGFMVARKRKSVSHSV
jgi:hypothetical protein